MRIKEHVKYAPEHNIRQTTNSYTRLYNEYFYSELSRYITGTILDLGANDNNKDQFVSYTDSDISRYISLDVSQDEDLHIVADGRCLPFSNNSIDTVILSAVLEHIPIQDVNKFLDEVYRILKSGGTVIAYIPFVYPLHAQPNDYYRPTFYGLSSIFLDKGFKTELYLGGGYSEVVLHVIFEKYRRYFIKKSKYIKLFSKLIFLPLHYLGSLMHRVYQFSNPGEERWYLCQMVVGKNKNTISISFKLV